MGYKAYNNGKNWEYDVMEYYMKQGYATIKIATEIAGTVFDIVAIRDGKCVCIECKHIQGEKLYFKGSGLMHKRDDLDNFCSKGNNVIIFVKSDKTGTWMTTWLTARNKLYEQGYITADDCIKCNIYKVI